MSKKIDQPGVIFAAPVLPLDVCMMAEALEGCGMLGKLVTRWAFTRAERAWVQRLIPSTRMARRPASPVQKRLLCRLMRADLREVIPWTAPANGISPTDASFAIVDRAAARFVGPKTSAVIGREDACLAGFQRARARGVPTLYHLQTGFCEIVKEIILLDLQQFPEAFDAAESAADFAPERLVRKRAELAAADWVLCPSGFVRSTVEAAGFPGHRVSTLPLGVDSRWEINPALKRENIFLYVGNVSARKGVHRVLKIWKQLKAHKTHRLRLVGDMYLPRRFLADYQGIYEAVPRLPRERLAGEYGRAQAFVFNALADGFGHVFAEAMSCGTAVLCSRNSGAPDLVTDGVEGRLYDYGDDEHLATVLEWALTHPQQLAEMGQRARQRAHRWGWAEFSAAFLAWFHSVATPSF